MSLSLLSSIGHYTMQPTDSNPYANYPTTYNLNFEASVALANNNLLFINNSNSTYVPNWTYSGTDGYFNKGKTGIYLTMIGNQAFMFYGSANAKTMTSASMPVYAGNIIISFRCGCSGNNGNGPAINLLVSINGGAFTNILSIANPIYGGAGITTNFNTMSNTLYTTSQINIPTTGTISLRFSTPATARGAYTMIDDIQIIPA